MQPSGVVACLKHYVGYGASEAGRDYVYTEISRQSLWDTYLQPFYHGVKAGALTVMSSFNNISGIPSSANHYTMTDVLKDRFKFKGFIVSDWGAVKQLKNQGMAETPEKALSLALNAGLDMDMMSHCYDTYLEKSINEGKIDISVVDKAVERVLYVKFKAGLFEHPFTPMKNPHERFFQKSAMDLESQLAAETMVLLKNDSLLPLINHKRIAIIGPLVKDSDNLLGTWAAHGDPNDVKTLFDGFCKEFNGTAEIRYAKGCNLDDGDQRDFPHAIKIAKWSDVIVLCLGEKRSWSGENASRASINLPSTQIDLLKLLRETGKPIVVVLSNGRPLQLDVVEPLADAILEIWQPGINGADAFAGILSGRINPSGRLSVTFPYSIGQIPIYYSRRKSGRNGKQGVYKDTTSNPLFPFGYGLSYSDFKMGDISISSKIIKEGEQIKVSVPVSNVGNCDGMQTVFWYISDPYCSITRPEKELKFFEKKLIAVGTTETYTFNIDVNRDLSFINADGKSFLEEGEFNIMANDKSIKIYLEK
jgi:beta-glucosidase